MQLCFLYRLVRFFFSLPCFPSWRILLFCYFVSALHPPPRSLRAWSMRIPLACCLFSCVVDVDLSIFSSLPSLFRFRMGHRLSSCIFLACLLGFDFCCDSFSIRSMIYIYILYLDTCVSWSHLLFLSEVYDLFQLLCYFLYVFICFLLR